VLGKPFLTALSLPRFVVIGGGRRLGLLAGKLSADSFCNPQNARVERFACARAVVVGRMKAKLAGGVAVIRVGGATEVEVKERKDRVDDAMHATRAAVEEGIVPGGGVALLRASEHLKGLRTKNDDQKTGVAIVRKALSAPPARSRSTQAKTAP